MLQCTVDPQKLEVERARCRFDEPVYPSTSICQSFTAAGFRCGAGGGVRCVFEVADAKKEPLVYKLSCESKEWNPLP